MNRIVFNVPEVRSFLRKHGEVYTIRKSRSTGLTKVYFGDKLVAIGYVRYVTDVTDKSIIKRYVSKSGFRNVDDWYNLAVKLHRSRNALKLYHVRIIRWCNSLHIKKPLIQR